MAFRQFLWRRFADSPGYCSRISEGVHREGRTRSSVPVQAEVAAQQHSFPPRLTGENRLIRSMRAVVFQQRETEVGAAVIQTSFFQPGSEFCVSTVARVDIIFPTRPDALVTVGRSNILLA